MENERTMFPMGEENTAYARYFTGKSWLCPLSKEQVFIANVTFEPGCRNFWHIHNAQQGGGQILIYVREGLSFRERELVTFCLLAAQGGCEAQLAGHVAGNFRVGNDGAALGEAVLVMLPWIGYPRSLNALSCVRKAMEQA